MATSVLDAPLPTTPAVATRRPPAVLALAAVCGVESLALLAAGLTGLDGLLTATPAPPAPVVVAVLGGLAGWIVACAGSALTVLEGPGWRMAAVVAGAEVGLLVALVAVGQSTALLDRLPATVPLPAAALLALAVPVGKLLLTSAPSVLTWARTAPPRQREPEPVAHPRLRVLTLAVIGLALCALAVTTPVAGEPPVPATAVAGG
ncbi:hypothetical protein SAMN05660690_1632 [Geodermatophilus telluris]|uniref:Uncharacterized protein n=1 Tax=Geodermatophilus telluris TaxID=1190417 RepID=A0A1G6M0J4_9ACTN|nr:hypothetical protein [Geodermatophilus telluris]SDC48989.1 hypothetical protein SAMN05660690_1632 [Geodermatophilus telluris]